MTYYIVQYTGWNGQPANMDLQPFHKTIESAIAHLKEIKKDHKDGSNRLRGRWRIIKRDVFEKHYPIYDFNA